jgi:drug/metabolite transporter (DMT)-like permease
MQMPRSQSIISPLLALVVAGIGWGTTGIFVRVLSEKGFTSVQLLSLRLLIVGIFLIPSYLIWRLSLDKTTQSKSKRYSQKTALLVGLSMVLYYFGAIVAVQNLPLVLAVLLIGSSPLWAWLWPLVKEKRGPKVEEIGPGIGVTLAIFGLVGFAFSEAGNPTSIHELEKTSPALGYLSGLLSAVVTVWNSRILKAEGDCAPPPVIVSVVSAAVGFVFFPLVFFFSESHQLLDLVLANIQTLTAFGVFATLIPGMAQAYASTYLAPVLSSTVTIQLQLWTAVFGWLFLNQALSHFQMLSAGFVVTGTAICLLGAEIQRRHKILPY